jgi:hypothetical protein
MSNLEVLLFRKLLADPKLREKPMAFRDGDELRLSIREGGTLLVVFTRPDMRFVNARVLVYVDGPHHRNKIHADRDAGINALAPKCGWHVIRIPHPGTLSKKDQMYVLIRIRAAVNHRVPFVEVVER